MEKLAIAEIEKRLAALDEQSHPFILELEKDDRKGVQTILTRWKKKQQQEKRQKEKFFEMTQYERNCRSQGFKAIAGVDEVGRGPLAGPVVAAAVILPEDFYLPGLNDSKQLSEKKRQEYAGIIRTEATAVGVSMIHAEEIDDLNIYQATKKAMKTAIASLGHNPDMVLIDAMKLELPFASESIIKGDAKSISIAAASIVAKVARDEWMKELAGRYPEYRFDQNMGYGTKEHIEAIQNFGVTPYHRKTFAPVKDFIYGDLFNQNT
ncbi:ribonuclease HII [Bacillus sp. FJAT-29814]|uniref:ribonuclease HII n=1 Tax=Bacillus sp. FJAT-29814 TaxID=1729688 RepID=UPI00082DE3AD|nr:ribonuclease HII [Bacillus sp. FJAT-29814]